MAKGSRLQPPMCTKSLVKPATATAEHRLKLSNLDRVVNRKYCSAALLYRNVLRPDELCFARALATLKESLARALVEFYPLAGRLDLRDESGPVDIHCNDAGAVFFETSADEELPAADDDAAALMRTYRPYVPDETASLPPLVIHATEFRRCGSLVLTVDWFHTVADASSASHFLRSWAELARGEGLSVRPDHRRDVLLAPRARLDSSLAKRLREAEGSKRNAVAESAAEVTKADETLTAGPFPSSKEPLRRVKSLGVEQQLKMMMTKADEKLTPEPPVLKTLPPSKGGLQRVKSLGAEQQSVLKTFPLSKGALQRVKSLGTERQFTTAEMLLGYLWRLMTSFRKEGHADQEEDEEEEVAGPITTRFHMFVDGRKRMGLPAGYFGNVVVSACATTTEADLLENPVEHAAKLIRRTTRSVTEEHFRSLIDDVEEHLQKILVPFNFNHAKPRGRDFFATFWNFFPIYETNFGWGRPSLAARNGPVRPNFDGIAVMPVHSGPGPVLALFNLSADNMRRLESEHFFSCLRSTS